MIAYVGQTRPDDVDLVDYALSHGSVATAAAALARAGGNLTNTIGMLWSATGIGRAHVRTCTLDGDRMPLLNSRAGFAIIADLKTQRLGFFACVSWATRADCEWGRVGELEPYFALTDVESVESMLYMGFRPIGRRRLRAVP